MRRRKAKKIFKRCSVDSNDQRIKPHLRNKWVRRYYVSKMRSLDTLQDTFGCYIYSKTKNTVRKARASEALWQDCICGRHFIKRTNFDDGAFLSTIFLLFDHGFFNPSKPVLFETMYFDGMNWLDQERDTSYLDAIKTHDSMLKRIAQERQGLKKEIEAIT